MSASVFILAPRALRVSSSESTSAKLYFNPRSIASAKGRGTVPGRRGRDQRRPYGMVSTR